MSLLPSWRLWAALGLASALILGVWYVLHLREEVARQAARADAAVMQSGVDENTAAITDRVASERVIIIQAAEEKASAIEAIPSDDIPADVLAGWRDGLRDTRAGRTDPDRPDELPGAVRGAEP
jgi:hypothetical protein